jgi:hypothetical protein
LRYRAIPLKVMIALVAPMPEVEEGIARMFIAGEIKIT